MDKNINEIYKFYKDLDRSTFMDNEYKKYACYDSPFPIGFEQTISQPSLVYGMTVKLDLHKGCKVLEIGTGSGYQTAFLAEFAGEVYTIERIEELSLKAKKRLEKLWYKNIRFKVSNGSGGWPEFAPYDRIIATAAAGEIPNPLVEQLKTGGKMLIPVGKRKRQELLLIQKDDKGNIEKKFLEEVRFVELKGEYGWKS